jgi:hypothetical protein
MTMISVTLTALSSWKHNLAQFCDFSAASLALVETSNLPYVAAWLHALTQTPACGLGVCLTACAAPLVLE